MKALNLPPLFLVTFPTHQFVGYIWTFLLVSHFLPFAHFSLVLRCSKLMVSLQRMLLLPWHGWSFYNDINGPFFPHCPLHLLASACLDVCRKNTARRGDNFPRATEAMAREKLGCRRGPLRSTLQHRPQVQSHPMNFFCFILKVTFQNISLFLSVAQGLADVCQVW